MRFNPPPYWPPAPPGWTPPPGWQPDPSWPPPPPGWQLWVNEPSSSRRTPLLIIGGVAVALVLVIGTVIAVVATRDDTSVTASTSSARSDEDQIKAAVQGFQDAWNNGDLAAFEPLVCTRLRRQYQDVEPSSGSRESGKTIFGKKIEMSVQSVEVNGDKANVTIKASGRTRSVPFVHESDGWKWCPVDE